MPNIGRPRTHQLPMDEIRRLTEEGWRLKKIAALYGCSAQTVLNRMREAGIARHAPYSCPGDLNPAWKGGRYFDDDGYVLIYAPEHPYATKDGRVREHRLVMERELGRYLLPEEVVDHRDRDRANNDPSNLRVYAKNADHLADTLKGRVPQWTEDGKRRIRERHPAWRNPSQIANLAEIGTDAAPSPR